MLHVPLAFKYVAITVMMAEANYCSDKLQLKEPLPINNENTIMQRASPLVTLGFDGRIDTPEYSFGFANDGKMRVITKLEDNRYQSMGLYQGDMPMKDFMERLSSIKSVINTNDAYHLATNWLTAVGIDVEQLQKSAPADVQQQFFKSETKGEVPCPVFYVRWGKKGKDRYGHDLYPVVTMMISGIDGELLNAEFVSDAYSKRSFVLINDTAKLLEIPDSKFIKYSAEQRSNLLVQFSAVPFWELKKYGLIESNAPAAP